MAKKDKYEGLTPEQIEQKKKNTKITRIVLLSVFIPLMVVFVINIVILPFTGNCHRTDKVTAYNGENVFIKIGEHPSLIAHRSGAQVAPEETMMALKFGMESDEFTIDTIEFDLHMTKDGELVLLHDGTLDRTSNSEEIFGQKDVKPIDKTLAELKTLNMGHDFVTLDGKTPYRDLAQSEVPSDLRIATLDEALSYLATVENADTLEYVIEIKDGDEIGMRAMDMLFEAMEKYDITDRVVLGTFQGEISKYMDAKYGGRITRSASILEMLNFYFAFLWGVPQSPQKLGFSVLQIPMGLSDVFATFATEAFVDYCHYYGFAVQYWTINDAHDMQKLVNIGADGIMTDNPILAEDYVH